MCKSQDYNAVPSGLSEILKKLRVQNHLSLNDVSMATHLSASYINRLENYAKYKPSIYVLNELARAYHVNVETLMNSYISPNEEVKNFSLEELLTYDSVTISGNEIANSDISKFLEVLNEIVTQRKSGKFNALNLIGIAEEFIAPQT